MVIRNVRVLIVDDESQIRALLREILREEVDATSCVILEAPDGQAAIDLLNEQEIDIVVTDMKMPIVDGLALLQEIRKSHPGTEVIVMTGYAEDYTREEAFRLGARDYITKPFEVDEVRLILMKSCLKAEAQRKSSS